MKRWTIGLLSLPVVVAAGVVLAQDSGRGFGPFPHAGGWGGPRAMSPQDRQAFADARIAGLHAGLKLTPDQEKLWPPVEEAMRGLAQQRREARESRRERFMAMRDQPVRDVPAQLRFMADRQAASADALRKLADASAPLHGALDEGQKRRLQMMSRFMGRQAAMQGGPMDRRDGMRRGALDGRAGWGDGRRVPQE